MAHVCSHPMSTQNNGTTSIWVGLLPGDLIMAAIKTAAQSAANWTAAMGSAKTSQAYVAGTAAVQNSPMAAAAAQGQKAATNYMNSINSGQWAAALNNVSAATWKAACAAGASRLASGAAKGSAKYTAAINALQ